MLKVTNFEKSYNKQIILKIDDLTIPAGISWIRGSNGTGKSTFLKSAAGIIAFDGDFSLNNVSIKTQPVAFRKLVNFAEAEPVFPEFVTGIDLIRLFSKAKDAKQNQQDYFIESMKMESYISEPVGNFSSGMLKKLSLLLAFIGNPDLILLDEPLITMDSESLETLYLWISEYHSQRGASFILSSHQEFKTSFLPAVKEFLVADQTLKSL